MNDSRQVNVNAGGDMVGVAVGSDHAVVSGTQHVVQGPGGVVNVHQVLGRMSELEEAVQRSALPPHLRDDALANVRQAREALQRDTPGVVRARNLLEGSLRELGESAHLPAVTAVATLVTSVLDLLGRLAG